MLSSRSDHWKGVVNTDQARVVTAQNNFRSAYKDSYDFKNIQFQIFFILPLNQTDMPKIIDFVVIKMKRLISEDKSEEEDVPEKVGD